MLFFAQKNIVLIQQDDSKINLQYKLIMKKRIKIEGIILILQKVKFKFK